MSQWQNVCVRECHCQQTSKRVLNFESSSRTPQYWQTAERHIRSPWVFQKNEIAVILKISFEGSWRLSSCTKILDVSSQWKVPRDGIAVFMKIIFDGSWKQRSWSMVSRPGEASAALEVRFERPKCRNFFRHLIQSRWLRITIEPSRRSQWQGDDLHWWLHMKLKNRASFQLRQPNSPMFLISPVIDNGSIIPTQGRSRKKNKVSIAVNTKAQKAKERNIWITKDGKRDELAVLMRGSKPRYLQISTPTCSR